MGVPGILIGCAAAALLARGVLAGAPERAVAGKPARAGQHDVLFVANVVDGTITLIDTQSLERLGALNAIPDGKTPQDPAQAAIYPGLLAARGPIYAYGVKVAPDGSRVYVSRGHLGDVVAIELATGKILWRFQTNSRRADHTALSPDGSRLFVSAIAANDRPSGHVARRVGANVEDADDLGGSFRRSVGLPRLSMRKGSGGQPNVRIRSLAVRVGSYGSLLGWFLIARPFVGSCAGSSCARIGPCGALTPTPSAEADRGKC